MCEYSPVRFICHGNFYIFVSLIFRFFSVIFRFFKVSVWFFLFLFVVRKQITHQNAVPDDEIGDGVGVPAYFFKIACFKYANSDVWDIKSWKIPHCTQYAENLHHTTFYTHLGDLLAEIPVRFYDVLGQVLHFNDIPNF